MSETALAWVAGGMDLGACGLLACAYARFGWDHRPLFARLHDDASFALGRLLKPQQPPGPAPSSPPPVQPFTEAAASHVPSRLAPSPPAAGSHTLFSADAGGDAATGHAHPADAWPVRRPAPPLPADPGAEGAAAAAAPTRAQRPLPPHLRGLRDGDGAAVEEAVVALAQLLQGGAAVSQDGAAGVGPAQAEGGGRVGPTLVLRASQLLSAHRGTLVSLRRPELWRPLALLLQAKARTYRAVSWVSARLSIALSRAQTHTSTRLSLGACIPPPPASSQSGARAASPARSCPARDWPVACCRQAR